MKIFDREVPAEWLFALRQVQEVCPEAVLAGGCLRDLVWAAAPKDLDVFVEGGDEAVDALAEHLKALGWHRSGLCHAGAVGYGDLRGATSEVSVVQTFTRFGSTAPDLQVIHLDLPNFNLDTVLRRMDWGPCQVGTDGSRCSFTVQALSDLAGHRFTLCRAETVEGVQRSMERFHRFRERFPGVTVDVSIIGKGLPNELR